MPRDADADGMRFQREPAADAPAPWPTAEPVRDSASARACGDGRDRLLAHTLDTLAALLPVRAAFAFSVDEDGLVRDPILLRHGPAEALVRRLPELEPIDPFSPRRAEATGAAVMSSGDVGGPERLAGSMYGRHLRTHGFGAPLFVYLRRDGHVTAGLGLLRHADEPPFDARAVRLVAGLAPMLEQALELSTGSPGPDALAATLSDAGLTVREAQIAGRVADGASNAAIAAELELSEATVKTHLTKVYAKLGVRTRTQLAVLIGSS